MLIKKRFPLLARSRSPRGTRRRTATVRRARSLLPAFFYRCPCETIPKPSEPSRRAATRRPPLKNQKPGLNPSDLIEPQ